MTSLTVRDSMTSWNEHVPLPRTTLAPLPQQHRKILVWPPTASGLWVLNLQSSKKWASKNSLVISLVLKASVIKPDNLSSIARTNLKEGEN